MTNSDKVQAYTHKIKTMIAPAQSIISGRYISVLFDLLLSLAVVGIVIHLLAGYVVPDQIPFISAPTTTTTESTTTETTTETTTTTTTPPPRLANLTNSSIFFLETSGVAQLTLRQLCAVEAAALRNPDRNVSVGIANKYPAKSQDLLNLTTMYPNVQFQPVDIENVLRGTKLEKLVRGGHLGSAEFRAGHLRDVLAAVILEEFGGIYMELDVITVKPLGPVQNALCIMENSSVGASGAVIAMEKHHPVLKNYVQNFVEEFEGSFIGRKSEVLLSASILKFCKTELREGILRPISECQGLLLMPPEVFLPIPANNWKVLFDRRYSEEAWVAVNNSYALHYWNGKSKDAPIFINSTQIIAQVARASCPFVTSLAMVEGRM